MEKKKQQEEKTTDWLSVIGKSLAFLCLSEADLRDKGLLPQANLLQALGLSRADAARILETSSESLRVLQAQAKARGAKRRGSARKTKATAKSAR